MWRRPSWTSLGTGTIRSLLPLPANDAQNAAGLVDGGDGESGGLADPQAAAVDQAETAAVNRIADSAKNAPNFGMGKRLRQPLLLGQSDLFLNSDQSLPKVLRKKNWMP